jgi:hypothetical protein
LLRYLAYTLVVANLGFFVWNVFLPPSPEPVVQRAVPVPPGVEPLVLLSERKEKNPAEAVAAPTPEAVEEQAVIAASETPPADETDKPSDDKADTAAAEPPRVCRTVGPFLDKNDATRVFGVLAKQGYVLNVRDGDVREPAGYWVYLSARSSKDARAIVADLDTHGMKDYFIGKQNHISLGIFSDKEKARTRQQTVRRLGYDAVLDQRYRMRDVYWLDVEEQGKPLLGSEIWRKLQAEHTDIRAQKVSCE